MYAVIRTGGKQYRVAPNDVLRVERLQQDVGETLTFDALALGDGETLRVGTPTVEGARVTAKVVEHGRGRKLIVFKYRRRKKSTRRKKGHRQQFTQIKITEISA